MHVSGQRTPQAYLELLLRPLPLTAILFLTDADGVLFTNVLHYIFRSIHPTDIHVPGLIQMSYYLAPCLLVVVVH